MSSQATDSALVNRGRANLPLEFDELLKELCENIRNSAETLYGVQKATISLNGSDIISKDGKRFRQKLKNEWERIAETLQEFRAFNGDVQILHNNIGHISPGDCLEFLEDMASMSASLATGSEKHYNDSSIWCTPYDIFFESGKESDVHGEPQFVVSPEPECDSHEQYYQSETIQSPAHKHGLGASRQFRSAAKGIQAVILQLREFWLMQNKFIEKNRANLKEGKIDIAYEEAKQYAERWSAYDKQTILAIVEITRVCDAITIDATSGISLPKAQGPIVANDKGRLVAMGMVLAPLVVDFFSHILSSTSNDQEPETPQGSLPLPPTQAAVMESTFTGESSVPNEDSGRLSPWMEDNIPPPPKDFDFSH
ncbi:hypothetical protein FRC17_009070 [Serendipita sp. 399]|nr:hypothetical protein FRC17_009070 [Serendipita sp. 399]